MSDAMSMTLVTLLLTTAVSLLCIFLGVDAWTAIVASLIGSWSGVLGAYLWVDAR